MTPRLIPLVVLAAAVAACTKSEAPPQKPAQAAAPKAFTPNVQAELDEGAKDRIARREAATRMLEKNVLEPTPPRAPEPPAAAKVPEPAPKPTTAPRPDQNAEAAKPAPAQPAVAQAPATPTPAQAPPVVAPKVEAAAAAPKVAAAAPAVPVAPAAAAAPRLLSRVDPDFPREAMQAGVDQGIVKARMTLDAAGGVTRVEIVDATPRRVFDRAVTRALTQWRYSSGTDGRTVDMEVAFKR